MQVPQKTRSKPPRGIPGFLIVWLGQFVSILASGMTGFGMSLWMYKQTESATAMGLMQVAFITPLLALSPIAGAMVDRYNRKLMMMISDLAAVLATGGIFILYITGNLQFWHLYISAAINGLGNTFQWPAYSAAISTMVPKEQYGRVNGLMSLLEAGPAVLSPILAGMLLAIPITQPFDSFGLIMAMDVATFFIAVGALALVHVPQPEKTVEGQKGSGNLIQEALFGFRYIFRRPSLLGLQLIFFGSNLFASMAFTLQAPMILARTSQNSVIFGSVQTAGAIGALAGGLIMSVWGGFKHRIHGVLGGWVTAGILVASTGIGKDLALWFPAFLLMRLVGGSLINASNQAIWQAKVAPDVQGRVFAARRFIAWFTNPIAPIIAGTLADFILEPAMKNPTGLTTVFGTIFGTGPGAGMGVLMCCCGLMIALVGFSGYFIKPIRHAETLLPDHDRLERVETAAAG